MFIYSLAEVSGEGADWLKSIEMDEVDVLLGWEYARMPLTPKVDSISFRIIIDCRAPKRKCDNLFMDDVFVCVLLFTDECSTKFAFKRINHITDNIVYSRGSLCQ